MEWDKTMLINAVRNTELIPKKQREALEIICKSKYPLSSKIIEKRSGTTKEKMAYSLRSLEKRKFIIKEKDGVYVYRPNHVRIEELIERFLET